MKAAFSHIRRTARSSRALATLLSASMLPVITAMAVALALSGCAGGVRAKAGTPVEIASAHVHSASCGHFRNGDSWYYNRGHVHGPSCGHKLEGGVWINGD